MQERSLKITGILLSLALGVTIYGNVKRKRKNKLAAQLLRRLDQKFNPGTAGLAAEKAFDIHYVDKLISKLNKRLLLLKSSAANQYAASIDSAWSWINDDEKKVYSVFRKLKDKAQVSQVAKAYQDSFGANLIDQLYDQLSHKEIGVILQIVANLPDYRTL